MAYNYQQAGDTQAAEDAIELHRQDIEKRIDIGQVFYSDYLAEAMARAIEGNEEGAFESIRQAIDLGFREPSFFREPSLQSLSGHPEFFALKAKVQQLVDIEHAEVLQLICHDNPIPQIWQPMKQTCAGVTAGP